MTNVTLGGANIQIVHFFDHGYLEEEKSMIHSFTVTFGAKYLTDMVTSVPPYETFSFIKKNIFFVSLKSTKITSKIQISEVEILSLSLAVCTAHDRINNPKSTVDTWKNGHRRVVHISTWGKIDRHVQYFTDQIINAIVNYLKGNLR
jgi:hypothetical protein